MRSIQIRKLGFWSGIVLVVLGMAYLGLVIMTMVSQAGFPPAEPFQSILHILIIFTAAWMVFFWSILHQIAPIERKPFSQASLAMIIIFATLTSINRYVGLTVVRQSVAAGNLDGLQWFYPYSWPSVMLALEFLAWGFFLGLACLCLAPVFVNGRLEHAIFWTLIATGILSLLAALGQVLGLDAPGFNIFTFAGVMAWGPGLTAVAVLLAVWFRGAKTLPSGSI